MLQNRPNWDEYFMGMAHYASIRSHDSQTKVGCVIVGSPNVVVGIGYNGFCSGVKEDDLPTTRPDKYPQYHTSGDNFDIVNSKNLSESIKMYEKCIQVFENNHTYKTTVLGEPMMGKRGLYPILSKKGKKDQSVILQEPQNETYELGGGVSYRF